MQCCASISTLRPSPWSWPSRSRSEKNGAASAALLADLRPWRQRHFFQLGWGGLEGESSLSQACFSYPDDKEQSLLDFSWQTRPTSVSFLPVDQDPISFSSLFIFVFLFLFIIESSCPNLYISFQQT